MGIAAEINRSQKHLERLLGRPTFSWSGTDYNCTVSTSTKSKDLNAGGLSPDADLNIYVRADVLGSTLPSPKEKLTYAETVYRIDSVSLLPGGGLLRLACVEANRGA